MAVRIAKSCGLFCGLILAAALSAQDAKDAKPPRPADGLKLPPGTVILVTSDPKAAARQVDAVVLSPDEYRKLLEAADQLRRLNQTDQGQVPASCRVSIRYDPGSSVDAARVRTEYHFRTERPKAVVLLGLQHARPITARYANGDLPILQPQRDGLAALVEQPGEYRLTVEMDVPVRVRDQTGERLMEVGLPGSAITAVERVELPPGAVKPRLAGQALRSALRAGEAVMLGPITALAMTWETHAIGPETSNVAVTEALNVWIDERKAETRARLTLQVLRGEVGEFRVRAPAAAQVTADGGAAVTPPAEPKNPMWIIRRPASADDQRVEITHSHSITRRPFAITGFPVAQAASQRGIVVVSTPSHVRANATPKGDAIRTEEGVPPAPPGERREAFAFGTLTGAAALVEVDPLAVKGELEVSFHHTLRLTESGWRLATRMELKPVRRELAGFELELPAALGDVRVGPAEIVELVAGPTPSIRLTEPTRQPVTVILEGTYLVAAAGGGSAVLLLPRVLGAAGRGGSVTVSPSDGFEVRGSVRAWDRDRIGEWDRPLDAEEGDKLVAQLDGVPARVDLNWQRAGAGEPVRGVIDIYLNERQGEVHQSWKFPGPARSITLRGPAGLAGRVRTAAGLPLPENVPGEWLAHPPASRSVDATAKYSFPLPPESTAELDVPLLWPVAADRCEVEVRVWTAPGSGRRALVVPGPWVEQLPRVVQNVPRLPSLCVSGAVAGAPLRLRWMDGGDAGTAVVIDRAWLRAELGESAAVVHARLLLRPTRAGQVIFELPGPAAALAAEALLDGTRIDMAANGWSVCVPTVAELDKPTQVFELRYQVPLRPGWRLQLDPPRPVVPAFVGPVRWQVVGPGGAVVLDYAGAITPALVCGFDAGLAAPRPAWTTAGLERWFYSQPRTDDRPADAGLTGEATGLAPLPLLVVPRPLVRLSVSLGVLGLGLLASGWNWTVRRVGWLVVVVVAVAIAASWRGQITAEVVAAAEPGILVLLLTLAALAVWRRREQSQAVFAPLSAAPRALPVPKVVPARAVERVAG